MSYFTRFSQATRWCLPPPGGLSWNIYGKFCLFEQTTEMSQLGPPSSPSPAFIFFIPDLGLRAQPKLCKLLHPHVKGVPLLNTGIFPMLTVDWNSWPFPLFFSILKQILRNTNFLGNQCNWTISRVFIEQIYIKQYNCPSANACLVAKASVTPLLLSTTCYHSLYVLGINASPLQNANTQKGNGAIWIQQHITPFF